MAQELDKNTPKQIAEDERFMRMALLEAEEAGAIDEVPVGAVIVSRGSVIARGHNLCERLRDFTAHAEMQAFTSASEFVGGKFLDECTLYVTLEPCPMCAGAGFWTRIGRIVYGAKDLKRGYGRWIVSPEKEGHGGQVGENGLLHPKTLVTSGILEKECSQLVKDFFVSKRLKNTK
ncbi:MAG TPA: nucleoside deaminase [Flavobacteriales bacterium]|jgi:tRNA(adenine34) deaminase|nr:nucleoside deaminase [Flavobacteriales bacterium]HIB77564.1 nucleoside deaminase [Flavobacteriales bacterium]HIN41761.1 nucleoside deaminase [Flavobacteriales bacterium]HIO16136.1 nucleoside deaminase [Flavobacteriales bacterium]HIO59023.1 nucleoside deaminase [Flavobacteriales bacterium]